MYTAADSRQHTFFLHIYVDAMGEMYDIEGILNFSTQLLQTLF